MDELELGSRVKQAEAYVAELPINRETGEAITRHWHHSARLSNGDVIVGGKTLDMLQREYELVFDPIALDGLTVLDIGTWHGSFSFEAERRGAGRVVAVDHFVWFSDVLRGIETFLFLRKDHASEVEYVPVDIAGTTVERLGTFDVVLFLGVFYHLQNPLTALVELARLTKQWLVLETHCDLMDDPLPAMRYYPGTELAGDPTNWWGPNPSCVEALLTGAGFDVVSVKANPEIPNRVIFHARKR